MPPSSDAASSAPRRNTFLAVAALILAAVIVYANSFSGPFIFDDLPSIPENTTIRHLATAFSPPAHGETVTGRPVLNLSFALNYALSGDRPWSYHALNLLIHVLAGLTLFGVVRRTLARRTEAAARPAGGIARDATPVALAVALLWLVHPLQTESVTYLVQRAESLVGLFYLLTLYCFIRGAEVRPSPREAAPRRSGGSFALAVVCCLLGMATKEVMVTAPVIVLLYDRTFLAGSFAAAWRRRRWVHLALAATWLPLAALVLHAANRGGSAGFGTGAHPGSYLASQFPALCHYLRLTVWPHPLIIDYGPQRATSIAEVLPYALAIMLLAAATIWALVRRPALGFLGACFFAILAPSSLVPVVRQTLAEHRMYLPLAAVLAALVLALYSRLGRRTLLVAVAAATGLGWLTAGRNTVYRSSESIWRDTVAQRPGNAPAHNNYGNILAQRGQFEDALVQYQEAIRLQPDYIDAHFDAGNALAKLGRYPEAIAEYEEALRGNHALPDVETALGIALDNVGRGDEAIAHYEQALRLDPRYVEAHNGLGIALAKAGRLPEAIDRFEQAIRLDPSRSDLHRNLGNVLRMAGRLPDSVAQYEAAARLAPDSPEAHSNLAGVLRDAGRLPAAIAEFEQALRLDPNQIAVENDLGTTLLMAGRTEEAVTHLQSAVRLDPRQPQVRLNLAAALDAAGRHTEAAAELAAARQLGADVPPSPE